MRFSENEKYFFADIAFVISRLSAFFITIILNNFGKIGNFMKMTPNPVIRIKDLSFLNQQSCKIKHPNKLEKALNEIVAGGAAKLQVVSDFDHTITKQCTQNGTPCATSFEIFTSCKSLPSNYISESKKLFNKYHPIEIDPSIPLNEKMGYMIEWWDKTNDILM